MKSTTLHRLRKSIFAKFTLSFISVGLIPLLVISYISLSTFSSYMERYALNNYEQMILFAGKNVDDQYVKYNNISKLMYSYGLQGKYGQFAQEIEVQREEGDSRLVSSMVDDFLRTVLSTDQYLQSVFFVFSDGSFQQLTKGNKTLNYQYPYPLRSWMQELELNRKALAFFPTHPETYYIGSSDLVMTFGRNLMDVVGSPSLEGRIVGTFFMDINLGPLNEIFQQMALSPKDVMYVLDKNNTIFYSNKKELIGKSYEPHQTNDYIHMEKETPSINWKIVGEFYREEMFQKVEQIINTLIIVIGLCMISLIIVAVWFSNRFSNPIRSITKQMALVESGNFDTQVAVRTPDELGLLARGFNKMVVRLQSYIDEVYVAQIKQKQAELNALKSQIRPHYLYNTLEAIRMSAVANDDQEVGDMILSLSHQLKYVLDYGEETVALHNEKTNIEQYFRLMELRYGENRLSMDFRFEADVLGCSIPKLSIQPLVENAVYHGIIPKSSKGTIRITASMEADGFLCITVDDDGVGMTSETLEQVRSKLLGQNPNELGASIGLKNVHDRIIALYGPEFGIEINSSKHIGTSVRMVIPFKKEVNVRAERHIGR